MAFMAMRKNLDDRARKKELDAIFLKFDKNHNGELMIQYGCIQECWISGKIFVKDFISDIEELDVKVDAQEKKKLKDLADVDGQVMDESKIECHDIWFHS